MMSSKSVEFLLRTSSGICVIITRFFFSRPAILGKGERRGMTCWSCNLLLQAEQCNSWFKEFFTLHIRTYSVPSFDKENF